MDIDGDNGSTPRGDGEDSHADDHAITTWAGELNNPQDTTRTDEVVSAKDKKARRWGA